MRNVLILFMFAAAPLYAQAVDYARANEQFEFPETADARAALAALDSSRAKETRLRNGLDSGGAYYDSLARSAAPYAAFPAFHDADALYSAGTDSLLAQCASRARTLYDSSCATRALALQCGVLHVEELRGIVKFAPFAGQDIYEIVGEDSAKRFVQTAQTHNAGDMIDVYAVRFGRQIFPSPSQPGAWAMTEGARRGGDSVYDVLREVPKPHVCALLDSARQRFAALQIQLQPRLVTALAALVAGIGQDDRSAERKISAFADSAESHERALWGMNMLLCARRARAAGDLAGAVDTLLIMRGADSIFMRESAAPLREVRSALDSAARLRFFGNGGLKNMALVPGGAVRLHTGEQYNQPAFFIDSMPVTNGEYDAFVHATGYNARGNWQAGFSSLSQTGDPVQGLGAEDEIAFAHWAGKRPAAPQEIEYVAASGFPTTAACNAHANFPNVYGVNVLNGGFYCARDLSAFPQAEQERLKLQAAARQKVIDEIVHAADK